MISSQIHIALVFLAVFVAISCASVYKTPAGVAPLHVSREQFNHATTNRGDPRVWIVLFHSTFCGSCQQFHSTWSEFAEHFSSKGSFGIGEVSIDTALGSELAQEAGALNDSEGVPNLRVYDGVDTHGTPIMTGEVLPIKDVVRALKSVFNAHGVVKTSEYYEKVKK